MPVYAVSDFRRGVDTRRPSWAAPAGALSKGLNVHITPGGDIETRKAFVPLVTLASTYGLGGLRGRVQVFGSGASAPANLPSDFDYTQLVSPTAAAMTGVLDIEPFDGKNYVIAQYGDDVRHFYNGTRVKDWDTDVTRYRFKVTGGSASAGVNKVSSITVNAVDILGVAVDWVTSHAATAAAIAAQINSFASTPNYTAYVPTGSAEVVIVSPDATAAGQAVVITVAGDVVTAAISGNAVMEAAMVAGRSARAAGDKMYVTSGGNLYFSATLDATNYSPDSAGGGFTNISTHSSGSEELVGTEIFYSNLIIFAKEASQRWNVEADDANNERLQTFRSAGLLGARACASYLDGQTYFLDLKGVRNIKTKDSSGRSAVQKASDEVNKELAPYIASLAASVRAKAMVLTGPDDDRLWVIIGTRIYVLSFFPETGVNAWTEYDPGMTIDDAVVVSGRLYVRSGFDIYIYGGINDDEYYAGACEAWLPYANFRAPTTYKNLKGLDLGLEGTWSVYVAYNLEDLDASRLEHIVTGPTFNGPNLPLALSEGVISLRLLHEKAERGAVDTIAFTYSAGDQA